MSRMRNYCSVARRKRFCQLGTDEGENKEQEKGPYNKGKCNEQTSVECGNFFAREGWGRSLLSRRHRGRWDSRYSSWDTRLKFSLFRLCKRLQTLGVGSTTNDM
jgi:hypothetical protein